MDKLVSTAVSSIPFLSSTDSTRLQMSYKQMAQTVINPNTEPPLIINESYLDLTKSSKLFIKFAEYDGECLYSDNELIILKNKNTNEFEDFPCPTYFNITQNFGVKLKNKIKTGDRFNVGNIIYEYDGFNIGVPSYGYNLNCAYMPFFGLNFEDAVVVSEHFCEISKTSMISDVLIPINDNYSFEKLYNNKYGIIPVVGDIIETDIVKYREGDAKSPTSEHSELKNAQVIEFKIHKIKNKRNLLNKEQDEIFNTAVSDYLKKISEIKTRLNKINDEKYIKYLIDKYFIAKNLSNSIINSSNIVYLLELKLLKEEKTKIGDKITNRLN